MAELQVSQKNLLTLFDLRTSKFIIPDYQRPYKWDLEKCEILWDDIVNFFHNEANDNIQSVYFLGTIVTFKNSNRDLEIIDGQQRITSLFLLLRAFYSKLEDMLIENNNISSIADIQGLINRIAPCIWETNRLSGNADDKSKIHLESFVSIEDDTKSFKNIMISGHSSIKNNDAYSRNFNYFLDQCNKFAVSRPLEWKNLCITILEQCVILPIECDTSETALTIFSTLNDRGLPLSDSDIFKAQIYKNLNSEDERTRFTDKWKDFSSVCKKGKFTTDDIFRYYSHYLRAKDGISSKEIGLRKFYAGKENRYELLRTITIVDELMNLANFWTYINSNLKEDNLDWLNFSLETKKYLHCLDLFPNDFWKYLISVFYFKFRGKEDFDKELLKVLKQTVAFLFGKFLEKPTVNAIKDDVYKNNIYLLTGELSFSLNTTIEQVEQQFVLEKSSKIVRPLLLLLAYLDEEQKILIVKSFDVEHIFPKKWQNTNYNGWEIELAKEYLDRIGNKIVLEEKINTVAGNQYFGQKKIKYLKSSIEVVKKIGTLPQNDWLKEDIEIREKELAHIFFNFLTKNIKIEGIPPTS